MNDYAFNEAPINANATLLGAGLASLQLTSSGRSSNVALGGSHADIIMNVAGDGTRWTLGVVNASMVLQVNGDGTRWTFGTSNPEGVLTMEGDGRTTRVIGGNATLVLSWLLGRGGVMQYGTADAAIELLGEAEGRPAPGRHGFGNAGIELNIDGRGIIPPLVRSGGLVETWIYSTGRANMIAHAGGDAALALDAGADALIGHQILARACVEFGLEVIRVTPDQFREVYGEAAIDIGIAFDARNNRVVVLPEVFYPAPRSRVVRVVKEKRLIRVPRPNRIIKVEG